MSAIRVAFIPVVFVLVFIIMPKIVAYLFNLHNIYGTAGLILLSSACFGVGWHYGSKIFKFFENNDKEN